MPVDRLPQLLAEQWEEDAENFVTNDELDEGMAEFFQQAQEIRPLISQVQQKVEEMKKLHEKVLSSPHENEKLKEELELAGADLKNIGHGVRHRLKSMERSCSFEETKKLSRETKTETIAYQVHIKRTQHNMLTKDFVDAMKEYNAAQVYYREKYRANFMRLCDLAGKSAQEADELLNQSNPNVFAAASGIQIGLGEASEEALRQKLDDIEARYRQIHDLETSITQLHEMFTDMFMLVDSQGEMINRVSHHVESAANYVGKGTADSRKAHEYQMKARKKKLLIVLTGSIVGFLISMKLFDMFGADI